MQKKILKKSKINFDAVVIDLINLAAILCFLILLYFAIRKF